VEALAFAPDGTYLAAGVGNLALVFDIKTGREISRLQHNGTLFSIVCSPNGQYIATGSDDLTARVFEASTGVELSRVSPPKVPAYRVTFTSDGRYVGIGLRDGIVFEPFLNSVILRLSPVDYLRHLEVAYTIDQEKIVVSDSDTIHVFSAANGQEFATTYKGHDFDISPDGKYLAAGSFDGIARLFDLEHGQTLDRFLNSDTVSSVAISPDHQLLAALTRTGHVQVFEISTNKVWAEFPKVSNSLYAKITFTPDGRHIVIPYENAVGILEIITGKEIGAVQGIGGPFTVSPDGRFLAAYRGKRNHSCFRCSKWNVPVRNNRGIRICAPLF
jgi:WD40 repeat protein